MARLFLIYDIPVKEVRNGYGVTKRRPYYWMNKMLSAGWARRVQQSVLEILEPEALDVLLQVFEEEDATYLLITGEVVKENLPFFPQKNKKENR